ncbi:putative cell cycle control protein cwf4 [Piedraia hortae CBS 480.64]|uniref:Putative cell cycle control protein cwf4 n=1 Tax=Piedraia hortae CBS 480.64 TaxID=1314780 RepID=A0A6A7BRG8_9PEZI|nr:putative cell cycle control protein cwf4 [Piedraia hortae CBS 480.64]
MNGPPRVRNKAPAPVQISAEQLLREAVDRQEPALTAPAQRFADLEELHEYQARKRKEFESHVCRNRVNIGNWTRYATWEWEQKNFAHARSVFERALDVDGANVSLWLRYIDTELKGGNIQHARNLLDRATTILPRVDKLWYKYVYVQEMLGEVAAAREVFERWMGWEPDEAAWAAYIKMEKRYGELDRARNIFERFTVVHPEARNWIKWARFEEENGTADAVREVFGAGIATLGEEFMDEKLFIAYAAFEARLYEYERAREIYKFALNRMPRSKSTLLHTQYTKFEKQFGDEAGVEDVVLAKRRLLYEDEVSSNPENYDAWFDLAKLEEASPSSTETQVREVYERAVANVPKTNEKRHWRRYIYLWLFYAIWEELTCNNPTRALKIYTTALSQLPKTFTSTKLLTLKSHCHARQHDPTSARATLSEAISSFPEKTSLRRALITLERKLFEYTHCREAFTNWLTHTPTNSTAYASFAELEAQLGEVDRARAIYEIGISIPDLDMPEVLWKRYIDFECEVSLPTHPERARGLYTRLLEKTHHPKVWIAFAMFEVSVGEVDAARGVFGRGKERLERDGEVDERVMLLQAWLEFENVHGSEEEKGKVEREQPVRVKKRRRLEDGSFEEYMDWAFPEAEGKEKKGLSKLLALTEKWKRGESDP